jgi:hypothetical protein
MPTISVSKLILISIFLGLNGLNSSLTRSQTIIVWLLVRPDVVLNKTTNNGLSASQKNVRPEILLIQISNMSGRWDYDCESDGNDSDVDEKMKNYSRKNHNQIQGNNCFTTEGQISIGPTQFDIESKLSILSMPKNANKKLSITGIDQNSIALLVRNFGQYAASLYQLIRLMKWELFLANVASDYPHIEIAIANNTSKSFRLTREYISAFLNSSLLSSKSKTQGARSISTSLGRMWTDYRNSQLLEWHKCILRPTRQFMHDALSTYYWASNDQTCNREGMLIPMTKDYAETILTMIASKP